MTNPTRDLATLVENMRPVVSHDTYVFVTLKDSSLLEGLLPHCLFREEEGLSAILTRTDAEALGFGNSSSYKMITLSVNSDLLAVGFLATVTSGLAGAGIPCNAVSAFHHDYLFVPEATAGESEKILLAMMHSLCSEGPSDASK